MTVSSFAVGAGRYRPVLFYPLVTLAYVATGRLGLTLAVSPGYATAFFLPSGIAVAAMWIRGKPSLPWVFGGSLLLNLWAGYLPASGLSAAAIAGAIAIAAASTLQAAVAGTLLRRVIGNPAPLDEASQLLRFLLLTPFCCLISATLSLLCLWPLGLVTAGDLAGSWLTWWIGDTRGVLVGVPLVFVVAGEPRGLWRGRTWTVALPMLLCFALFTLTFVRLSAWEADEQLAEFRLLSQHAADKIQARLEEPAIVLEQLQRDMSREAPLSLTEFRTLVRPFLVRFPIVQAIEWAPDVPAAQRTAFEATQRTVMPDYTIHEFAPSGARQGLGNRSDSNPVAFVEPLQGNEPILGADLLSTPELEAAIAHATASGKITATAPLSLVQAPAPDPRLLLTARVRGGGNGSGVVMGVLRLSAFVGAEPSSRGGPLSLRFVDLAEGRSFYDDFPVGSEAPQFRQEFEFGQRRYELQTAPTETYLLHHSRWESFALLSAGVYGTALLGGLLLLGTGYAHRVRAQVEERTRSLAEVNARLKREIEEREQAEAALRHAHRLEAIGQLTGGIAHDFNNLLTVVSANAELLSASARSEAIRRRATAILRASTRGARLTRQLLAFSRRQALRPETIDLRERTAELAEMLSRSLQENIDVTVDLPDGLWPVMVDLAEFELAMLNIAVNARDAMPDGGKFRVAAENISRVPKDAAVEELAGDFVTLRLSDTGSGMAPEIMARAFEPYFTTKDIGAGSGLGLSQVYGFAKQSGGEAAIASEPGRGTTVTLYLPRAVAAAEPAIELASPRSATG